jgi:hypothetical protein
LVKVEAAGIESVNQRGLSRPTRPQSHATPQKNEGKPRLAEPGSTHVSVFGGEPVPKPCHGVEATRDSKVPPVRCDRVRIYQPARRFTGTISLPVPVPNAEDDEIQRKHSHAVIYQ